MSAALEARRARRTAIAQRISGDEGSIQSERLQLDKQVSSIQDRLDLPDKEFATATEISKQARRRLTGSDKPMALAELGDLPEHLAQARSERTDLVRSIHNVLLQMVSVYEVLYGPAKTFIEGHPLAKQADLELVSDADGARGLREIVENPADGQQATRERIEHLVGSESVAQRASEMARVRTWRNQIRQQLADWLAELQPPAGPRVPPAPVVDSSVLEAIRFLPDREVAESLDRYRGESANMAERLAREVTAHLDSTEGDLGQLEGEVTRALAQLGFEEGSEVLEELRQL